MADCDGISPALAAVLVDAAEVSVKNRNKIVLAGFIKYII